MELPVHCELCPRRCGAARRAGAGFCGAGATLKAARAALHFWEEPCISGRRGSGTVFFTGCALRCCYCQNFAVSQQGLGKELSFHRLAEIFLELQQKGAANLNLVTATQWLPWVTAALDARGYQVNPIASPEPHEKARHYLWRFWTRLPKAGHIAIFDRSWYGRVMVERIEGFCAENDWQRAYNEINEFEAELADWGAVILKFWVHIDKDTQLARFKARQECPEKQWKITDEDWRNREKWDGYEQAVDEMLQKTSTEYAPWHILQSVDKKYARVQALELLVNALEKALD